MGNLEPTPFWSNRPGKWLRKKGRSFLSSLLTVLFLLLLWQLLSILRPQVIPPPLTVCSIWFILLKEGSLLFHAGATAFRAMAAIGITTVAVVPVAIVAGRSERIKRITAPFAYLLYPVPKVALLPVIMLLFGLGNGAKIILLMLILFFQMFIALRDGIASIPDAPFTTLESFGAGPWEVFRFIILPAGLPRYLTSLRIGTGTSLAALFFSETFATRYGLGFFIMDSWMRVNYPEMFAGILSMALLGYLFFSGIDLLEKRFVPWRRGADLLF